MLKDGDLEEWCPLLFSPVFESLICEVIGWTRKIVQQALFARWIPILQNIPPIGRCID